MTTVYAPARRIAESLVARNEVCERFFRAQATPLAEACRSMADRFLDGGRLIAFGRGPYATDAQHVSVEFVHPVIVGKRALPALDLSTIFPAGVETIVRPADMVMGFGPPEGDPDVWSVLARAGTRGAMTFALPGREGSYAVDATSGDPFVHQEIVEMLYHILWESVHVFFEHRELGHEVGEAGFLYPFLGREKQETGAMVADVAASVLMKVRDDAALRSEVAGEQADAIAQAVLVIHEALERDGKMILLGNGGSATDANDWAIDCVQPPAGWKPIPAVSLSAEPVVVTAIGNDVGIDVVFLRQLIAHAQPHDVVVSISTSGGSRNVIAALEEARRRKLHTIALLGYDGGQIVRQGLAEHPIVVRSDYIPRIQEVQASIYHVMRERLEELCRG